ncbi:type II toxin-antitoxin system VapC family toxin [candidate division KSB1 bacterium]|nr:type II toxin-antitoxin system VapC family toxin [bacterium]NUM67387.1 type II toxin-antitoxin system VapC family toxin [candidate division KSB1 bacterium]
MNLLLDSHAFIWWSSEPEKLSPSARAYCEDGNNMLLLSVASVWEMQIKLQLGKLKLFAPLRTLIENQQRNNALQILRIDIEHAFALEALPLHHKDPFDRMLIAQANTEELFLLSKDEIFKAYPVKLLW